MRKQVDKVNQNPPPADRAADVFEAIHGIMHAYRARRQRALRAESGGVTFELAHMEMRALGFFARHPGATQSDLVAHANRDKAQVARLIRGLREHGLLSAEADENDKRSTRLRLSEQGVALHASLHRLDAELAAAALASFSAAERGTLLDLLGRLRDELDRLPG